VGVITLDLASVRDLPSIRALLVSAGLPEAGLMEVPTTFMVARHGDRIVAAGALERHGSDALLRSLVVAPEVRSSGIGSGIVAALERLADENGVGGVYLLTDTAARFFAQRGYRRIGRDDAPEAVQASVEWSVACDKTAIPMARES
jgi:amino-acid N-acetyltransferase